MSAFPTLSIARTASIYDVAAIRHAMENIDGQYTQALKRTYGKMLDAGPDRFVAKPSGTGALLALKAQCPNFAGVIDDLAKYVELALFGTTPLNFMPILLAGDPGVGKTHFAKQLAAALGLTYRFVSMGTLTAGFVLSGSAPTWAGARQGKVADALISDEFANPLFLLDEVDKRAADERHDPFGALLQLLERETAQHFTDEYLDIELDASYVLWVATANDLHLLPDYILSRMATYEVPAPTREQAQVIAQRIYAHLLEANGWPFAPTLEQDVLEMLGEVPPRDMRKRLLDAMGSARTGKRDHVMACDVGQSHGRKRQAIGFSA